ncbi:MAG: 30S ribosomal protein S3 [Ruminococcaceae bacterium]|jgi:small subunit ribosomal protein S3|nr:30S ribosomal protein S3 [Oscillospiraceae bacterium]
MGQKVNPHGIRVGVIKDWDSRWFTSKREFGDTLVEDYKVRKVLKKQLYTAGVPKIEIERTVDTKTSAPLVRVTIYCAKPGMVIGKGGSEIGKLQAQLEKMLKKSVNVNIVEVGNTATNAQLVAEDIASQLERRIAFRRATKMAMRNAMQPRRGSNAVAAKGIKIQIGGRLNGADIARSESYHEGTIPLQTLRADIDYGFAEANTTYGKVGVKVWVYKGEVLKSAKPVSRKEGGNK